MWSKKSIYPNVETIRYSKRNLGKKVRRSSSSLQQSSQNFQIFSIFDNKVTLLEPFGKYTSIREPIGSGLKPVAASSVSERYQTSFCAQVSKNLFENVKFFFDLIREIFNIQKSPSKITRYGITFKGKREQKLRMTQKQK